MKLIDAVKNHKGSPFCIPDANRFDIISFIKDMNYKVGAEIGVYKGQLNELLLKTGAKIYAVDPYGYTTDNVNNLIKGRQATLYQKLVERLAPYPNSTIIRKTSMKAVEGFKDSSLDFVYIDGDHRFRYVAEDLYEWSKKVRKGGMVSGHDYRNTGPHAKQMHVYYVVQAYTKQFGIENWYVVGADRRIRRADGTLAKRDTWRSFFWIKE